MTEGAAPGGATGRRVPVVLRALGAVDWLSAAGVIAFMAVMVAVVSAQVFLRYLFNASIDWADELSRLCFVWAIFLAIPHALKRGAHVGVDLVVRLLPARARLATFRVTAVLGMLLMAVAAWQAVVVAADTWDQLMPTIDASSGWFYVAVVVGCAHSVLHLALLAVRGGYPGEAAE